jgi:hypothetical protein
MSVPAGNRTPLLWVAPAFLASEMRELEPRSESFATSLLEGMEAKKEGKEASLNASFIHSAVWALPTRSAAKNGGAYYTIQHLIYIH